MKTYSINYSCKNCGNSFNEIFDYGAAAPEIIKCNNCGLNAKKQLGISPRPEINDTWPWKVPEPWKNPYKREPNDPISPYKITWDEDRPCKVQEFFRKNPDARVAMISCDCPKCSPRMVAPPQSVTADVKNYTVTNKVMNRDSGFKVSL